MINVIPIDPIPLMFTFRNGAHTQRGDLRLKRITEDKKATRLQVIPLC